MLDKLRASKGGIITWIFLGAIIVVFVISFGPGSFTKDGAGCGAPPVYAARVNGEVVPAVELQSQIEQMSRFLAQLGQDVQGPAAAAIRRQAMDTVVDAALVIQEARRRGVVVTDADVQEQIGQMQAFAQNGAFQLEAYKTWASQNYGSPAKFEQMLRDQLLRQRMLAIVDETVKVSDAEVKEAWRTGADRAELVVVQFPLAAARSEVKVSDADVKAFADREGARIAAFHAEHPERFDQKRRVRARHILIRAPEGAPADADQAARARLDAAVKRLAAGEDFAKVAGEVSEDANTRDRGGELGIVSDGVPDAAFSAAVLPLEKGARSEPFRTPAGWHVAQVEEVFPAVQVPLERARLEIARELLVEDRAGALARARAQAALDAAKKGKALAAQFPAPSADGKVKPVTLGGAPVVAQETGPFGANVRALPPVGAAPELVQAALAAGAGEVLGKVFDAPAGPVVASVKLRERPDEARFAAERAGVEERLRTQKQAAVRVAWLETLRKDARVEENPIYLGVAQQ